MQQSLLERLLGARGRDLPHTATGRDAARGAFVSNSSSEAVALSRGQHLRRAPRAPEPLSGEEIAQILATLPPRRAAPPPTFMQAESQLGMRDLPLIKGADLGARAARFERDLAKCETAVHASAAQQSLDGSAPLAQPELAIRAALQAQGMTSRAEEETQPAPLDHLQHAQPIDTEIEQALGRAMATLRLLSRQSYARPTSLQSSARRG
jgi:hypothetical protein